MVSEVILQLLHNFNFDLLDVAPGRRILPPMADFRYYYC